MTRLQEDCLTASRSAEGESLGVLATRRKPLQDSPTPAGNPMAAIALMRLHHFTGDAGYRDKAELTLETFAGVAEQFGIFAATYGIAVVHLLESPVQVVVIAEDGDEHAAGELYAAAVAPFAFNKTTLRLSASQAVAENLPPALAATIPHLPGPHSKIERQKIFRGAVLGLCLPTAGCRCGGIAESLGSGAASKAKPVRTRSTPMLYRGKKVGLTG